LRVVVAGEVKLELVLAQVEEEVSVLEQVCLLLLGLITLLL
jgi:hypothetical protein